MFSSQWQARDLWDTKQKYSGHAGEKLRALETSFSALQVLSKISLIGMPLQEIFPNNTFEWHRGE